MSSTKTQAPKPIPEEEFDGDMAKKVVGLKAEAPFKVYGIAVVDSVYQCVSANIDTKGKILGWKVHFHPEPELEFAQDTLKKVLAYEGVRY